MAWQGWEESYIWVSSTYLYVSTHKKSQWVIESYTSEAGLWTHSFLSAYFLVCLNLACQFDLLYESNHRYLSSSTHSNKSLMFYVKGFRRMITTEAINSDLIWLVGGLKLLHHCTCVKHVPRCMQGSLTSCPGWTGLSYQHVSSAIQHRRMSNNS